MEKEKSYEKVARAKREKASSLFLFSLSLSRNRDSRRGEREEEKEGGGKLQMGVRRGNERRKKKFLDLEGLPSFSLFSF